MTVKASVVERNSQVARRNLPVEQISSPRVSKGRVPSIGWWFEVAADAQPKWLRADPNVIAADLYFAAD